MPETDGPTFPYPELEEKVQALQAAADDAALAFEAHGLPTYAEVIRGSVEALTMKPAVDRGLTGERRDAYLGARHTLEALIELRA